MNHAVWVLDEDDDNLAIVVEVLAHAGAVAVGFSSTEALLAHASRSTWPRVAVVDAATAAGFEQDIRRAIDSRLVILATWPSQLAPWRMLGAAHFLFKPYEIDSLVAGVQSRDRVGHLAGDATARTISTRSSGSTGLATCRS
jgi:DNA-binding NtrC family response regulator